ncbi:hypothetical protein KSP35_01755 [Aquihabitans sp. G128]|uniref:hypothetical protein n=1 Tax=Aquihabitans sp. G128 TaxID=2849779 RepID=UPI001C23FAFC|nr:hypothetical protein [Aquihabitans sp. G128]QXC61599.1 hypothetical protein KSP35_01755 [Aquihabitans sp. G128]
MASTSEFRIAPITREDLAVVSGEFKAASTYFARYGIELAEDPTPADLDRLLVAAAADATLEAEEASELFGCVSVAAARYISGRTPTAWSRLYPKTAGSNGHYHLGLAGPGDCSALDLAAISSAAIHRDDEASMAAYCAEVIEEVNEHFLGPEHGYASIAEARKGPAGSPFRFRSTTSDSGLRTDEFVLDHEAETALYSRAGAAAMRGLHRKTVSRATIQTVELGQRLDVTPGLKRWTVRTASGEIVGDLTPAGTKSATRLGRTADLSLVVTRVCFDLHGQVDDVAGILLLTEAAEAIVTVLP